MKHYDEAITKLSGFKHVEESYSVEFEKLWAASASFGVDR